jgi:hypothetical protein
MYRYSLYIDINEKENVKRAIDFKYGYGYPDYSGA